MRMGRGDEGKVMVTAQRFRQAGPSAGTKYTCLKIRWHSIAAASRLAALLGAQIGVGYSRFSCLAIRVQQQSRCVTVFTKQVYQARAF